MKDYAQQYDRQASQASPGAADSAAGRQPRGRHLLKVCVGSCCQAHGGAEILQAVQEELGIGPGETTPDLRFSLEKAACLDACNEAPAVAIDGRIYGRMDPELVRDLLAELRKGE